MRLDYSPSRRLATHSGTWFARVAGTASTLSGEIVHVAAGLAPVSDFANSKMPDLRAPDLRKTPTILLLAMRILRYLSYELFTRWNIVDRDPALRLLLLLRFGSPRFPQQSRVPCLRLNRAK